MFCTQTNPIFFLALVFLLAGNLGSHIFADAIECNRVWELPSSANQNQNKCGTIDSDNIKHTYLCKVCKRGDGKSPSASGCIGPHPLTTNGSLDCDAGTDTNADSSPGRPYFCFKGNPAARDVYRCTARHLNQQCDQCTPQN
ncbi:uncharacterized protein MELLADRAFT_123898 [Melampsora larici-populina 98AG31]|uniref:Secreted protein n=1 Tax=Melampsora larici-populina (strain 98AG31 / pathotype 3-4-7) TaxID=747676 RepID=F4S9G8_MELLP|nr:uncharacterized protein MELLADRAFT_123898 [Melampsora larici-populina 98AG31]EGF98732.1 secreted protein [Melampsora larici-populina 98AG31]